MDAVAIAGVICPMYDINGMVKQFLPILVAAGIIACPLLCGRGANCCHAERAPIRHACCDACHESDANGRDCDDSAPSEDAPGSPQRCHGCICGGAVVENLSTPDLVLDSCNWIASPASDQVIALVTEPHRNPILRTPLPDDDMNPGRALRCLMMSYLC